MSFNLGEPVGLYKAMATTAGFIWGMSCGRLLAVAATLKIPRHVIQNSFIADFILVSGKRGFSVNQSAAWAKLN
jgi:hypothetical protein